MYYVVFTFLYICSAFSFAAFFLYLSRPHILLLLLLFSLFSLWFLWRNDIQAHSDSKFCAVRGSVGTSMRVFCFIDARELCGFARYSVPVSCSASVCSLCWGSLLCKSSNEHPEDFHGNIRELFLFLNIPAENLWKRLLFIGSFVDTTKTQH